MWLILFEDWGLTLETHTAIFRDKCVFGILQVLSKIQPHISGVIWTLISGWQLFFSCPTLLYNCKPISLSRCTVFLEALNDMYIWQLWFLSYRSFHCCETELCTTKFISSLGIFGRNPQGLFGHKNWNEGKLSWENMFFFNLFWKAIQMNNRE